MSAPTVPGSPAGPPGPGPGPEGPDVAPRRAAGGVAVPRSPNRPAGLNRVLLAVVGLVCLLAGLLVLVVSEGWLARLGPVPLPGQDTPLIPPGRGLQPWVYPMVAVLGVLVGLLCLRWLGAQTSRRPASRVWRLPGDPSTGITFLGADVAARAVARDVAEHPAVLRSRAVLLGERREPTLHLSVLAHHDAPLTGLRRHIDDYVLPRLCQALELDGLPTDVLIRLDEQPLPAAARLH